MVLAAGFGTRLRPLTSLRPKALCPVGGVPLVDHALDRLEPFCGTGADRLVVNAHHLAEQVVDHVGDRAHVSVEERVLGTAGGIGAVRDRIAGRSLLLTNADSYLTDGLARLVDGWDGQRCRLLVVDAGGPSDFGTWRYVGACLLPWRLVADLAAEPSGLYQRVWGPQWEAGRLELVASDAVAVDCGTPADYLRANLLASGGISVVGDGAVVDGTIDRCVVWDGAHVAAGEHLVETVRAGSREHPVTVPCT